VACDFLVAVTARFRILFVFVALEIGSRRILHCNVTAHPTAEWTLQQLRDALPSDHPYQFLIHDCDTIFSSELDAEVKSTFGLRVLRTPVRAPQANTYCERLIGTVRRECLDFMIPLDERQLRGTLRSWVAHYCIRDIGCLAIVGSQLRTSWAVCIMNISWKSVSPDAVRGFCGAQGLFLAVFVGGIVARALFGVPIGFARTSCLA
jgi:hypothetical protein